MVMIRRFWLLVKHDIRLHVFYGYDAVTAVLFYVLTAILFGFGIGSQLESLPFIASGIVWVAVLLATLLSLDRLFQRDYEDGSLEILWNSSLSMEVIFLAKIAAHWLITAVPLIVVTPLVSQMLGFEVNGLNVLMVTLILGTLSLSVIGGLGASLTIGARNSGLLLALVILPFYIPVLIFGTSAVDTALSGMSIRSHLFFLGGFFIASVCVVPWVGAAVLRQTLHS